jgi:alpha-glucosidase
MKLIRGLLYRFLFLFFFFLNINGSSAESWMIRSFDSSVFLAITKSSNGISFSVANRHGQLVWTDPLRLTFSNQSPAFQFQALKLDSGSVNEKWSPLWGTDNAITNRYKWLDVIYSQPDTSYKFSIHFKLYDDAIAYCFEVESPGDSLVLMKENSSFHFTSMNKCWWSWADYNTLEKEVYETPVSQATHVSAPFTFVTDSGDYMSILEAAIDDYSSMTLRQDSLDTLTYHVNLVPWADGTAVKVKDVLKSPWRVMVVTSSPAELLSSKTLYNLNAPPKGDFSWVKPMVYMGVWWEMHLGLSTWKMQGNRHGANTSNVKKYIDFAAKHDIGGVLVEGWNTGWEHWGQKEAFDFTTPYPDFDLPFLADYAGAKGVQLIGHHETGGDIITYESHMDSAFALYQRLGIQYVKTGYAGPVNPPTEHHHGQYMIAHFNKVMRTAAQYHLMLDVHEPCIPSGWGRTYPNLMTFEGVRGMEWNAWSKGNPPSHTCRIPFTRGLAGPMDYTPGIFDILEDDFKQNRVPWNGDEKEKTAVHSTLSNQLALMVVNYSPLQMAADLPVNYDRHPAFHFIEELPSSWDESVVLDAVIGQYIVVARRKGTTWFIAGITNERSRTITLPVDFLREDKQYQLDACIDNASSHYETDPESYVLLHSTLNKSLPLELWMAPGGGAIYMLKEK